jgi:hypothetical protein
MSTRKQLSHKSYEAREPSRLRCDRPHPALATVRLFDARASRRNPFSILSVHIRIEDLIRELKLSLTNRASFIFSKITRAGFILARDDRTVVRCVEVGRPLGDSRLCSLGRPSCDLRRGFRRETELTDL